MQQIDVETRRSWNVAIPVTVLGIRSPEDRAQWFIPVRIHVDA
jgi:hypothetical protein